MTECWLFIFSLSLQVFRIVLISGNENEDVSIIPLRINYLAVEAVGNAFPMMDGYDPRKSIRAFPSIQRGLVCYLISVLKKYISNKTNSRDIIPCNAI